MNVFRLYDDFPIYNTKNMHARDMSDIWCDLSIFYVSCQQLSDLTLFDSLQGPDGDV